MFWPFHLWRKVWYKEEFKIQTFTYYIPAPPPRKSGYREKEFDKIFYEVVNKGFEILNVQTQSHTGANSCGMWVIFTLRATNQKAQELDLDELSSSVHEQVDQPDFPEDSKRSLDLPEMAPEEEQQHLEQLYYLDSEQKKKSLL